MSHSLVLSAPVYFSSRSALAAQNHLLPIPVLRKSFASLFWALSFRPFIIYLFPPLMQRKYQEGPRYSDCRWHLAGRSSPHVVEGEDRCTDLRDRLHSPGWRRLGISNWFIQNGRFGRQGKDLSGGLWEIFTYCWVDGNIRAGEST